MARVICVASPKGGVGKTLLTVSFSSQLAMLGRRVLAIDTDAATNGLSTFHVTEALSHRDRAVALGRFPRGMFEAADPSCPLEVCRIARDFDLLPAAYHGMNIEAVDVAQFKDALRRVILEMGQSYDYIFLDGQAGADSFAQVSMSRDISDMVVIVSDYDGPSVAGTQKLKQLFPSDLDYGRTWCLYNRVPISELDSTAAYIALRYLPAIPWIEDVSKAYVKGGLALNGHSGVVFSLYTMRVLQQMLSGTDDGAKVSAWLEFQEDRAVGIVEALIGSEEISVGAMSLAIQQGDAHEELLRYVVAAAVGVAVAAAAFLSTVTLGAQDLHVFVSTIAVTVAAFALVLSVKSLPPFSLRGTNRLSHEAIDADRRLRTLRGVKARSAAAELIMESLGEEDTEPWPWPMS